MANSLAPLLALIAAAGVAAALTRLHVALAARLGHFAPPDTLHRGPVVLSGGIAIWVAVVLVTWGSGELPATWLVIGPALVMVAIGLWDDVRPMPPTTKLLLQFLVAGGSVALGLRFHLPGLEPLGFVLSVVWLVAMANAVNLIDNMDGLAPGLAVIAALLLAVQLLFAGAAHLALLAGAFAGAHAGFLPFNVKPARVFLGDCGSMGAGFLLGALGIVVTWSSTSDLLLVIATPLLLFAVPIFNILFVLVTRTLAGVSVLHGRADHINYRLVAHGLSERQAVVAICALSAVCGLPAVWYGELSTLALAALLGVNTVAFLYLGVFLDSASVRHFYRDFSVRQTGGVDLSRLPLARHWWRLLQMVADLILVAVAYYLAYLIRFEGDIPSVQEWNFVVTVPLVSLIKIAVFVQFGLYGSHWRYVGLSDLLRIVPAVALSQFLVAAAIVLVWPGPPSRSVLVIDAVLTVLLVGASRILLRLLHESILRSRSNGGGIPTVIVGADDSGELMLRLARNGSMALKIVGFVDDDPRNAKAKIHGVEVLGSSRELPVICGTRAVQLAVVAMPSASARRIDEIVRLCRAAGVRCKVLSLTLDDPPATLADVA